MWYYADMRATECMEYQQKNRTEFHSSCDPKYRSFSKYGAFPFLPFAYRLITRIFVHYSLL